MRTVFPHPRRMFTRSSRNDWVGYPKPLSRARRRSRSRPIAEVRARLARCQLETFLWRALHTNSEVCYSLRASVCQKAHHLLHLSRSVVDVQRETYAPTADRRHDASLLQPFSGIGGRRGSGESCRAPLRPMIRKGDATGEERLPHGSSQTGVVLVNAGEAKAFEHSH